MRPLRYALLFAAALALSASSVSAQHALTTGPTLDQPVEAPEGGGGVSITQNQDLTVTGGGVACANQAGGFTVDNAYWRVFPLADFPQITEFFSVESVDIGVAPTTIGAEGLTTEVRIYRVEGGVDLTATTFPISAATLLTTEELIINSGDPTGIYNVVLPPSEDFAPTDTVGVAWFTPDGSTTTPVSDIRMGINSSGETGSTYLEAVSCGAVNPTTVGSLGFPTHHWVVQVNGILLPTAAEGGPELPARVTLGQSHPNPVRGGATVPFTVHEPSHVRVAVYDVLGREVAVLADGAYAAGSHAVTFEAAGIPGGTYLCRIEADGTVQAQTMTLVK